VLFISVKFFLDSIYRLPILMYHSIDYAADKGDRMFVSPEAFARQIKFLHDHKYSVISLEKAVSYIENRKRPPAKTVAITFDDGYEDNYRYAYGILKQYDIPATIFVIVDLIGKDGFLNWAEIKEMSDSGLIDIESHTMVHPYLMGVDDDALKKEFRESKRVLEEMTGKDVDFICYPMGVYDERTKREAKEAGYKAAFATKPTRLKPNYDIYEIKRVRISATSNNMFVFMIKISGYHSFFKIYKDENKDFLLRLWKRRS
jgi:peptidoglycan/xylan/chitin deacetylase (PgdA/CDA1 family)